VGPARLVFNLATKVDIGSGFEAFPAREAPPGPVFQCVGYIGPYLGSFTAFVDDTIDTRKGQSSEVGTRIFDFDGSPGEPQPRIYQFGASQFKTGQAQDGQIWS
jgi:hypothetical protein